MNKLFEFFQDDNHVSSAMRGIGWFIIFSVFAPYMYHNFRAGAFIDVTMNMIALTGLVITGKAYQKNVEIKKDKEELK